VSSAPPQAAVKTKRITLVRRLVQVVFLFFIMYGAFIWTQPLDSSLLPAIPAGTPRTTQYARDRILWVSGNESVLPLYLPVLACRFIAKGGLFKSCSVHLLSENITWRTAFKILLPQLFFLVLLLVIGGKFWCGWTCPLGAIQDAMTWVRQRFARAPVTLSDNAKAFFFKTRHFLLWATLAISTLIAFPVFGRTGANDSLFLIYCQLCPARLLYPPMGGVNPCWYDTTNAVTIFLTGLGWFTFGAFFLGFLIPRFWCRVCAVGALSSYFSRGAAVTLEKANRKCTSCGACRRCCPVDVERVYREKEKSFVVDSECIGCLTCVEVCPEKECLSARLLGKRLVQS
jgi:Pyruvate/2-oxoacid:ferredoxin oxidoreductase delta subunit